MWQKLSRPLSPDPVTITGNLERKEVQIERRRRSPTQLIHKVTAYCVWALSGSRMSVSPSLKSRLHTKKHFVFLTPGDCALNNCPVSRVILVGVAQSRQVTVASASFWWPYRRNITRTDVSRPVRALWCLGNITQSFVVALATLGREKSMGAVKESELLRDYYCRHRTANCTHWIGETVVKN